MKEIPILFSMPMVQAIQENRKFMTRRVCKDIPNHDFHWGLDRKPYMGNYKMFTKTETGKWDWVTLENQWLYDLQTAVDEKKTYLLKCPYGQPGDRLWVRETWTKYYYSDENGYTHYDQPITYYAADGEPDFRIVDGDGFEVEDQRIKWKPSIHMPKIAARIWLEVVNVRVERLQEISEEDAKAEGLACLTKDNGITYKYGIPDSDGLPGNDDYGWHWQDWNVNPIKAFQKLWDKINAKNGHGWDVNDWLWVVEFKKHERSS